MNKPHALNFTLDYTIARILELATLFASKDRPWSLDGIIRAKGHFVSCPVCKMFSVVTKTDSPRDQVIRLESKQFNEVNDSLDNIAKSGGSGEAHLFAECQWREVQKVIREVSHCSP